MRRLLPLSLALALHTPSWAGTPIDVVILCDAGYPPYSYVEGGKVRGIYTDILSEAFSRMPEYRVQIRPMAWARGLAELANGHAFALFPPYYRPRERPWMDYSRPIMMESVVVFARRELARKDSIERFPYGYGGLRVGVNRGFRSIVDPDYQAMVDKGVLSEIYANDNWTNLLKLYRRRIDIYINDRRAVLWQLRQMQREGVFAVADLDWLVEGPWLSSEAGYLGYTRLNTSSYPYKDAFKQRLDQVLVDLEHDGSIYRIVKGYDLDNALLVRHARDGQE